MPENIPSSQSEISLREYIESRLDSLAHLIESKFLATQQAVNKAEHSMNERLKGMNEFRDQLTDQAAKFATITQMDDRMNAALSLTGRVEERLRELERNVATRDMLEATMKSRAEALAGLGDRISRLEKFMWLLMGAFILLQVIARYLPSVVPLVK